MCIYSFPMVEIFALLQSIEPEAKWSVVEYKYSQKHEGAILFVRDEPSRLFKRKHYVVVRFEKIEGQDKFKLETKTVDGAAYWDNVKHII